MNKVIYLMMALLLLSIISAEATITTKTLNASDLTQVTYAYNITKGTASNIFLWNISDSLDYVVFNSTSHTATLNGTNQYIVYSQINGGGFPACWLAKAQRFDFNVSLYNIYNISFNFSGESRDNGAYLNISLYLYNNSAPLASRYIFLNSSSAAITPAMQNGERFISDSNFDELLVNGETLRFYTFYIQSGIDCAGTYQITENFTNLDMQVQLETTLASNTTTLFSCNGKTNNTQKALVNMTFLNEHNNTKIWNYNSLEGTFFYWNSTVASNTTLSFNKTNLNESYLCLSPPWERVYLDSKIKYWSSGFDPRFYYHANASFTNITLNRTNLYLLDTALATGITFSVLDPKGVVYKDLNIQALRYDAGNDSYRLVAMGKTDDVGQDLLFLRKNDAIYKFNIYNYTSLLFTSKDTKLSSADNVYTITINPETFADIFSDYNGILANLSYNVSNGNFTLVYVDPSGTTSNHCMKILRRTISGDTNASSTCLSASSGTISRFIGNQSGTLIAQYTAEIKSELPIASLIYEIGASLASSIGAEGALLAALVFITICLALLWNPVAAIVGGITGLFFMMILDLFHINTSSMITLIIMALIIIWKMRS